MAHRKIMVSSANIKSAEVTGIVTVGPESAKKLGVPVGTEVDLGRLAYYNKSLFRRVWGNLKIRKNPFNS